MICGHLCPIFSLSVFLRSTHVICISTSFLVVIEYCSIECINHRLLVHSVTGGHLASFHLVAIVTTSTMDKCVCVNQSDDLIVLGANLVLIFLYLNNKNMASTFY